MAKYVRYVGDSEGVTIAATDQWVAWGETVKIEDNDLAAALLQQEANWEQSSAKEAKEEGG